MPHPQSPLKEKVINKSKAFPKDVNNDLFLDSALNPHFVNEVNLGAIQIVSVKSASSSTFIKPPANYRLQKGDRFKALVPKLETDPSEYKVKEVVIEKNAQEEITSIVTKFEMVTAGKESVFNSPFQFTYGMSYAKEQDEHLVTMHIQADFDSVKNEEALEEVRGNFKRALKRTKEVVQGVTTRKMLEQLSSIPLTFDQEIKSLSESQWLHNVTATWSQSVESVQVFCHPQFLVELFTSIAKDEVKPPKLSEDKASITVQMENRRFGFATGLKKITEEIIFRIEQIDNGYELYSINPVENFEKIAWRIYWKKDDAENATIKFEFLYNHSKWVTGGEGVSTATETVNALTSKVGGFTLFNAIPKPMSALQLRAETLMHTLMKRFLVKQESLLKEVALSTEGKLESTISAPTMT